MTTIKIAPSILAADFVRLGEEVLTVLQAGADYIHVDVMDGLFVPNISIGVPVVESLRRAFPEVFLDVHLMISAPVRYVEPFCRAGASLLVFHVEADTPAGITEAIRQTKAMGVKAGLALKPATSAEAVAPWLEELDLVLGMTVEPGFSGQHFMTDQIPKLRALHRMIQEKNPSCELEADGGIAPDTAPLVTEAGVNVLVAGNAVFGQTDPAVAIQKIRNS